MEIPKKDHLMWSLSRAQAGAAHACRAGQRFDRVARHMLTQVKIVSPFESMEESRNHEK